MTRSTALTFALLLAAGPAAAQSPTTPTGQPASPAAARQDAGSEVTISGCLRSSAAPAAGSERAPAPSTQAVTFSIDVAPSHAPSGAPQSSARGAEAGGVGTTGGAMTPATYSVAPATTAKVDLAKHINHMVQLKGILREPSGPSTAGASRTAPSREMPETTDPTAAATARTFEVTEVKEIATSCPAK